MNFLGQHINELLNLVLALIMFGLGLGLKKEDFKQLFDQPKPLAVGLFSQMFLLPLVAFLLVFNANISNELKMGVMILSFCPGGITSNLVSYFVKGNVALAVSLTVSNAFLSLLSIPLLVNFFLHYFEGNSPIGSLQFQLPFFSTVIEIFCITILPAALGMAARYKLGKKFLSIQKWTNIILPILLLFVFGFKFLAKNQLGGTGMQQSDVVFLTPIVILLNVCSMVVGFVMGKLFQLSFKNRITIAVEVGLHNTALALLIAGQKLHSATMEKPALVYALYSFAVTFAVAWILVKIRFYRLKKRTH